MTPANAGVISTIKTGCVSKTDTPRLFIFTLHYIVQVTSSGFPSQGKRSIRVDVEAS